MPYVLYFRRHNHQGLWHERLHNRSIHPTCFTGVAFKICLLRSNSCRHRRAMANETATIIIQALTSKAVGCGDGIKKTFKKTFTVHVDGLSISSSTIFIDVCIFQLVSRNIFPNHTKSHTDSKCKKRSTNFMLMHCKSPSFFAIFESQNDHQSS